MRKADNGLRILFRTHLKVGIMWTSIETGATAGGVADSNYLSDTGCEGWVEYKATDANAVKFEVEQIGWHLRRARYGGRTWIAIRKQHEGGARKGAACDELWMVRGCKIQEVAEGGVACGHAIPMGDDCPARWQWSKVRRALLGGI